MAKDRLKAELQKTAGELAVAFRESYSDSLDLITRFEQTECSAEQRSILAKARTGVWAATVSRSTVRFREMVGLDPAGSIRANPTA
jgi:hypothetical protein